MYLSIGYKGKTMYQRFLFLFIFKLPSNMYYEIKENIKMYITIFQLN